MNGQGSSTVDSLEVRTARLHALLAELGQVVVAFSGGVDSTLVAAVASRELGGRATAITGVSPSLAESERAETVALARRIGIRHIEVPTHELERAGYVENSPQRCYHCKDELYSVLRAITTAADGDPALAGAVMVDGCNLDDTGDHRPGRRAAAEHGVRSPLLEAAFTKQDVRALSRSLDLPTWDKPAMACLASRIPYGTTVTVDRLRQVAQAESALRAAGFRELRVRHHGELARIEVPPTEFERLLDEGRREQVLRGVRAAGFRHVTLDLRGFRSGSMNEGLDEQLHDDVHDDMQHEVLELTALPHPASSNPATGPARR